LAAHAGSGKLTFGIVSALWAVSGGIGSMISSLNLAHHVRETRPWFKVRAMAMGLSLLISILILTALLIVLIGSRFVGWLGTALGLHPLTNRPRLEGESVAGGYLLRSPIVCADLSLWSFLKQRRRWHWVSPGGAFGVFVWLAARTDSACTCISSIITAPRTARWGLS
jgi:membrane protein